MDEVQGPPSEPKLDDSFEVPTTPTSGQMSDTFFDALILAGVRKEDAKDYAVSVMKNESSASVSCGCSSSSLERKVLK